ncbi:MAG: UvrD-helicase domain-containing protein [Magnetococcales bacterium]|nr:UvrD-helicase domain-containing protein [Magnetococcales bacterium]
MAFYADLHVHSRHSRATSRDCDLEHLALWAAWKGLGVVGSGDFTHPAWLEEIRTKLVPAEPGLFRLRPDLERGVAARLKGAAAARPVRFALSVEVSTIYKKLGRTRKVHHLICVADLEEAGRLNGALERIGNLASDGRPILGLDSRNLLEITLAAGPGAFLIPAHIWTPWFSLLGSQSGFDSVQECYGDLASHIFALETGLSSDPAMNWRVSSLDPYRLVSHSDAHSPAKLGREATVYRTDLDYFAMRRALETGQGYGGTVEFFPEEGKYHLDGHRRCAMRLEPRQTREAGGLCPVCGRPVTVGVLHRVEALADRTDPVPPVTAGAVRSFIPLVEIIAELEGVGPGSARVTGTCAALLARLGPELDLLGEVPLEEVRHQGAPLLAEALDRLRAGRVIRQAGYDGEYGVIRLFEEQELRGTTATPGLLFDADELAALQRPEPRKAPKPQPDPEPAVPLPVAVPEDPLAGLDPDQRAAALLLDGPLLILAGPGTGKTRTLTQRIAHQVARAGGAPESHLAVTFTRRAAAEMRQRLALLLPGRGERVPVFTFHALALTLLREFPVQAGFARPPEVAGAGVEEEGQVTLEALLPAAVELLEGHPEVTAALRRRYSRLSVDEFQDIDPWQYRLLRALAPADGHLCVIGDPDQAIYGFRGADPAAFDHLQRDYPTLIRVRLRRNYRSTAAILQAAGQVMAASGDGRERTLLPQKTSMDGGSLPPPSSDGSRNATSTETSMDGGSFPSHSSDGNRNATSTVASGQPLLLHRAASVRAEAEFVIQTIERLLGGHSFFSLDSGRSDGRTRGVLDPGDFAILYRTGAQAGPLAEALTRSGLPFARLDPTPLAEREGVAEVLTRLATLAEPDLTRRLAQAAADLEQGAALLNLLAPLARDCADLAELTARAALDSELDQWDPRGGRIALLTLHAAKGLEFPVVFITGCEDGLIPLHWNGRPDRPEEERRLFYVGMTRARERLVLTSAARRKRHNRLRDTTPAPFLAAIDPELLQQATVRWRARKAAQDQVQKSLFDF